MEKKTMSMTDFRSQMYKWEKTAKLGDTLLLTHNGVVVLTVIKGDQMKKCEHEFEKISTLENENGEIVLICFCTKCDKQEDFIVKEDQ